MTESLSGLLVASLVSPLMLLGVCLVEGWRERALALQWLVPAPSLAAGLIGLTGTPLAHDWSVAGLTLRLDRPGALLLASAALLWMVVSAALWRDRQPDHRFGLSWLLTMTGNLGAFIAGDLVSFYFFYALASIPAFGLFALSDEPEKRRAGAIYMAFTILGEAALLLAFAMLVTAEPLGSTHITDVMAALPASAWRNATLGLVIAGFGMKIGMIPFNGWMPLAYRAAPISAAAVLSGAGVNAGVIGLIRFLPLGVAWEGGGNALVTLGFLSAFYGVALGLTQRDPRVILAYSSISQMGVITAALGAALVNGQSGSSLGVAFYAANHQLVKAALFLTIGGWAAQRLKHPHTAVVLGAVLALSLAGLPPTGGALAKLATKAQFAPGSETILSTLSSVATALLMTHFMLRLAAPPRTAAQECPASLARFWPAIAVGAILLPWVVYPEVGSFSYAFAFRNVVDGLWPSALGVALVSATQRVRFSPRVPVGDGIVIAEAAFRRLRSIGASLESLDRRLRQWPAAGVSFASILLALLAAAVSGG